jgi:hypothetical protein
MEIAKENKFNLILVKFSKIKKKRKIKNFEN